MSSFLSRLNTKGNQDYYQKSATLTAKEHIEINAEKATFDTAVNQSRQSRHESDLKVGQFSRVSSPLIDILQTVETVVKDKEASDRIKTAQLMGAAAKGYTAYTDYAAGGALLRVESGSGFSHKSDDFKSYTQESLDNTLNAKDITVTARTGNIEATQTDFLSRDENGNRIQNSTVTLNAKKDVILKAGESLATLKGRQQSAGVEVGTGFAVGAQTGWYVYAQAGFTNGKQEETHRTYQNSRIDTEIFNINAGGNATFDGGTARAKTINADIKGDLAIISRQDEHIVKNSSTGASLRVQGGFGTAWGASGNINATSGNSLERQMNEQSGFFAEDGGYHINANNIHLKGGAIASTNPENSELSTNKLTFEDIQNESKSRAVTAGISGSANLTNVVGNAPQNDEQGKVQAKAQGDFAKLTGTPQNNGVSTGLPMFDQSQDSTTTKATLTEGKITLNKDTNPTLVTAKSLGINTAVEGANQQVEKPKDVKQQLKEQQILTQAAGDVYGGAMSYVANQEREFNKKIEDAEQAAQNAMKSGDIKTAVEKLAESAQYKEDIKAWQTGGDKKQMATAIATALSLTVAGRPTEAIAVGTASPYVNEVIKDITNNPNLQGLNIPLHALWGAVEAHISGGNATTGAIAGGGGEALALLLTEKAYGKKPPDLTEAEKQELINVVKGVTGLVSAVTAKGNLAENLAAASTGMKVAESAVEFNLFSQVFNSKVEWFNGAKAIAESQEQKVTRDRVVAELIKKDHPVIYKTAEGAYFFISTAGEVIQVARELAIELSPLLLITPLGQSGTGIRLAAGAVIGGATNISSQLISGQEFNWIELGGAVASGTISPYLKRTQDVIRVNMGISMGVGLANGRDGIQEATLGGMAAYGSSKVSNPIIAASLNEIIQKMPTVILNSSKDGDEGDR